MAFSDLGSLGATGSTANNQATLVLTTTAAASAGELVVLVIGDDNIDAVNSNINAPYDGKEVASISDDSTGGPNKWGKAVAHSICQSAAQGGAACQIWYSILEHDISNGGTITVTFTNATLSDATAISSRHFSFSGSQVAIENVAGAWSSGVDPASTDATTANIECLRIRGIAGEVGTSTGLTVTTNWTDWDDGNSATSGTTTEICVRAEHRISTGTSDASDPTWVACDNASGYVAFREIQTTDNPHYINVGDILTGSSATSLTPGLPGVRKNGNLLLAFCHVIGVRTISVSGTGWTLAENTNNGTDSQAWAWCIVSGSEASPTFSWTSGANCNSQVVQYCNSDQVTPNGAFRSALGSSTTLAVSSITTTRDNVLIACFLDTGASNNCPPTPANYSQRMLQSRVPAITSSFKVVDQPVATSGSSSDSVSVSISNDHWRGTLVEILSPLPSTVQFRRNLSQLGARIGARQRMLG